MNIPLYFRFLCGCLLFSLYSSTGKSMPTEKFCARKIKKFTAQGNRLMLPGMEHAYLMSSLKVSPRFALNDTHIKLIEKNLEEMRPHLQNRAEWYGGESEFWDGKKRKKNLCIFWKLIIDVFFC